MTRRLILALAPALLATAAMAQPPGPPPGARGPHGAPSAEMKARHEAMRTQHLEDLKTVLRLRPDQEAALAAFATDHHRMERREPPKPDGKPLTTPERLERMERHRAEMAAHQERARASLAKFYAALSPDQQKVFDALHRLKGGPGHMMMGHQMMKGRHMRMGGGHGRFVMRRGPGGPEGHGPTVRHDPPR